MKPAQMLIEHIRRDGGTQIRAALDEGTVADYSAALENGAKLPPPIAYYDGTDYWLADGFHRVEAELRLGHKRMAVEVAKGTREDAVLAACAANQTHGLRRSNADKRRAVETAMAHPTGAAWSTRQVAKHCGVSHMFVSELRNAATEKLREVAPAEGVNVYTQATGVTGSKSGQPTAGLTPPANPTQEGDGGAASSDNAAGISAPMSAAAPSIDLLGLDGIDPAWLALATDVCVALDAFGNHLRQAQGDLSDLRSSPVGAQVQALRQSAHELAARGSKSVRPKSACLYCKDSDGTHGRRAQCSGCRGLGWLTEEQLGAVPRELTRTGEAAQVIDTKRGGFVPRARALKIELVDEAGASTAFGEDDGGPGWE